MRIVMLGHSNAGKTTYVSSMYEVMAGGIEGFSLSAERAEDHERLTAAARAVRYGRYPDMSDHRAEYALRFRHNDSQLIKFTWLDYRGGALLERSDTPQTAELREDLKRADGIVIFVDAPELATSFRARRKARSLVFNVSHVLESRKRTTPIVIAFTKWDLLQTEPDADLLLDPFASLLEAIADTSHIHGTVVELACGPSPRNVDVPVLWCLLFGIQSRLEQLSRSYERHLEAHHSAAARDTTWDRVRSWWNNDTPQWQHANAHASKANKELDRLVPLLQPSEHLLSHLDHLPYF